MQSVTYRGRYETFPFSSVTALKLFLNVTAHRVTTAATRVLADPPESGGPVAARTQDLPSEISFDRENLTAPPTEAWLTNGGTLFNQRYSPLDEVNRDNVESLRADWKVHLHGSGVGARHSGEAQPLIYRGVIYIVTAENDVFALSVETGHIVWKYEAHLYGAIDTICCGATSRGLGMSEDKIYVGQLDGKLVALDQATGSVVWSVQAERWQEGYTITSAPLYYDGLVITGFAGADFSARGRVKAFDADDGSLVWTFYTIPGPGEVGHDTWPSDSDAWMFGGGTVWNTPAVDPDLGLVYFQTGNPSPNLDGSARPGDNLFTCSVVAVDAKTGEYRWHYQMIHHDIWDFDGANPVVLFDVEVDGEQRLALAAAGKTGWVYILDRTNGTPLIGIEERAVPQELRQSTSPTQPYPLGDPFVPQEISIAPQGARVINRGRLFTPFWTEPVTVKPGSNGGANWAPSAYDPSSHFLYVCARDGLMSLAARPGTDEQIVTGELRLGGTYTGSHGMPTLGVFSALDMQTNRLVWQQQWGEPCNSGSVATAGGIVFVGRRDGRLTALDSSDGSLLWEFQTGAGVHAAPSVFEHRGKQYVVAYAGGHVGGSVRGDSVYLFSLEGALGPSETPGDVSEGDGTGLARDPIGVQPDTPVGRQVYVQACVFCHGNSGEGGHGGVALTDAVDEQTIRRIVEQGRNEMPALGTVLSPTEIREVAAYIAMELGR